MEIKILYEDEDILAIDKPSGIAVHKDGRNKDETIADWVLEHYPMLKGVGEPVTFENTEIDRPGIVHRLDKETSGVLLIMKTPIAFDFFKKQFMNRKISKTYLCLVYGEIKKEGGVIDAPIGRSPSDFRRRLAGRGARGEMREAITEYKVLKRIEINNQKYTLLEIYPKTGRTHQIRVHMKYLSYPVVCDKLYAPNNICPPEFGRLMLHAKSIEFLNMKNQKIKIESDTPDIFLV